MPDVSTFIINGQSIKVYDESARTQAAQASSKADAATNAASAASSKATAASSKADEATKAASAASSKADAVSAKVDEIAALSRLEISYSEVTKTITITTGNHEG